MFCEELEKAGLYYVEDMYDTQGKLRQFDYWLNKGVPKTLYMMWAGLTSSVKDKFTLCTDCIVSYPEPVIKLNNINYRFEAINSKTLYDELIKRSVGNECNIPKVVKYLTDDTENYTDYEWKEVFKRIYLPMDVKTRDFQYRFLYNILSNNHKLHMWHLKSDSLCDF